MSNEIPPSTRPIPPGPPSGYGTVPPSGTPYEHASAPPVNHRPQLSLTQIIGSALAAMTAAAIGSRLGVGGTIIGAAVASVVAAVGSALYTSSLRTTHEKVRTTLWAGRPQRGTRVSIQTTNPISTAVTAPAASISDLPTAVKSAVSADGVWAPDEELSPVTRERRPLPWKRIAGVAMAAFALAAIALTGVELLTGTALSGGDGTTITRVTNERGGRSRPAPADSTASPSEQASAGSSADSSSEPSDGPSAEANPSASASASEPAAEPSDQATTEPSEQATTGPSEQATTGPSDQPTTEPSVEPGSETTTEPTTGSGDTGGSGTTGSGSRGGTDSNPGGGAPAGTTGDN